MDGLASMIPITVLLTLNVFLFSVIAAVKNEQAADDLSTPYKKILLSQIQQKLASPSASDDLDDLHSSDIYDNNDQDSLNLSSNSSISHRKKTKPTKYITNGLYKCDRCNKRFEYQSLFEQHCCFKMAADERSMDGDESTNQSVGGQSGSMMIDEGDSNSNSDNGSNGEISVMLSLVSCLVVMSSELRYSNLTL